MENRENPVFFWSQAFESFLKHNNFIEIVLYKSFTQISLYKKHGKRTVSKHALVVYFLLRDVWIYLFYRN
jgi:hypothetical protein